MKESTKMMRVVMEELKVRFIKCKQKNTLSCLPFYDSDKELMRKIQNFDDTISFFEHQIAGMEELSSTNTHRAYINKARIWIIELRYLKDVCLTELDERRMRREVSEFDKQK